MLFVRHGCIEGRRGGYVLVRLEPLPRCSDCAACWRSLLDRSSTSAPLISIRTQGHGEPHHVAGTRATVSLPGSTVLRAGLLAFGIPLLGIGAGVGLMASLFPASGDGGVTIGLLCGLLAGALVLRFCDGSWGEHFRPVVEARSEIADRHAMCEHPGIALST